MMRGLVGKELRQHGMLLGFLFLIIVGGLGMILSISALRQASGSSFLAVRLLLVMFVPLACFFLGHALIATEFRQKTQLFLEGLPLPRWRMLLVKYGLGLGLILAAVIASIGVAWAWNRGLEAMTPRFAMLLVVKSASWTVFMYSAFFAHAFLGRYRVPFAVLVLMTLMFLSHANVDLTKFGPFELIDDRLPYERVLIPAHALWVTLGTGALLTAFGFALGLVRDATVASLLAEKMSSREKAFTTFLLLAGMMTLTYLDEHYASSTPVKMPGAYESIQGAARVSASAAVDAPNREELAVLEKVARATAADLGAMSAYLHCEDLPPVFIVHRRDLKGTDFQKGDLKPEQGLMVRVNVTAEGFQLSRLRPWLIRNLLSTRTHGLAERERNAWVLDGFATWWAERKQAAEGADWEAHRQKAVTMSEKVSESALRRWLTTRKDLGEDNAGTLAASGIEFIAQQSGDEACQRFLHLALGSHYPPDVRGWLRDVSRPMNSRLQKATGLDPKSWVSQWRASLTSARKETKAP